MKMPCLGLASEHRFSDAIDSRLTAPLGAGQRAGRRAGRRTIAGFLRALLVVALLLFVSLLTAQFARAQEPSAAQPSAQASQPTSAEPAKKEDNETTPKRKGIAGTLAQETREATGAEEEEHADLKHAAPIRWLARKMGLSVHGAHLLLIWLNFAIIVVIVFWAVRKFVPGVFRNRSAAIQRALEEARAASQDASRRLADIENRLRQLDVEIGRMQATAEKEGDAEEVRMQQTAEEDIRKVVIAAEQEIATAAKQARRELTTHTADLALALARQQINVDSNTDQVLVRTFAAKLAAPDSHKPAARKDDDGGKDGR
jgi:F-type H+-transporting ATPase subunit b